MNYSSILDVASKAAAGVGVILGISYAVGLFKMISFLNFLNAGWMFGLLDVQAFINEGLPDVILLLAATLFFSVGLTEVDDSRRRLVMWYVSILISVVMSWFVMPYLLGESSNGYLIFFNACIGIAGAVLLARLLRSFVKHGKARFSAVAVMFVLLLILMASPSISGYILADNIKYARESATEVVNENNKVIGVLVRMFGGKYVLLDCNVRYQMTMVDVSSSLKLRRSSGHCKAIL